VQLEAHECMISYGNNAGDGRMYLIYSALASRSRLPLSALQSMNQMQPAHLGFGVVCEPELPLRVLCQAHDDCSAQRVSTFEKGWAGRRSLTRAGCTPTFVITYVEDSHIRCSPADGMRATNSCHRCQSHLHNICNPES